MTKGWNNQESSFHHLGLSLKTWTIKNSNNVVYYPQQLFEEEEWQQMLSSTISVKKFIVLLHYISKNLKVQLSLFPRQWKTHPVTLVVETDLRLINDPFFMRLFYINGVTQILWNVQTLAEKSNIFFYKRRERK